MSEPGTVTIPARVALLRIDAHPNYRNALRANMHPIALAPKDYLALILSDGTNFSIGSRWKHWSMDREIWWSEQQGAVLPTHYLLLDAVVEVASPAMRSLEAFKLRPGNSPSGERGDSAAAGGTKHTSARPLA